MIMISWEPSGRSQSFVSKKKVLTEDMDTGSTSWRKVISTKIKKEFMEKKNFCDDNDEFSFGPIHFKDSKEFSGGYF